MEEECLLSEELVAIADDLLDMKECPIIRTRFEDDGTLLKPGRRMRFTISIKKEGEITRADNNSDKPSSIQSISELLKELFDKNRSK